MDFFGYVHSSCLRNAYAGWSAIMGGFYPGFSFSVDCCMRSMHCLTIRGVFIDSWWSGSSWFMDWMLSSLAFLEQNPEKDNRFDTSISVLFNSINHLLASAAIDLSEYNEKTFWLYFGSSALTSFF